MAGTRKDFSLCETMAGALHMVGEAYGIDGCWLPWQFERHVLLGGANPFRITTSAYPRNFKDGVDKVSFEISFDNKTPNLVKYISFDELPSKGKYIVTQTSIKHLREGGASCALWIEIPKGADREGISGIQSLLKAEICCAEWKDFLPPEPETPMERAQLVIAQGDTEWLKKQVAFKDSTTHRLSSSLAYSRIEITALQQEIMKLAARVVKTEDLQEKITELKAELKTESKAKDAAVEDVEGQVKMLKTNIDKLQGTLKTKVDLIHKLRGDLKAKGVAVKDSDSESPDAAGTKKRKFASIKTPNGKDKYKADTPNTAPAAYGGPSTPYTVPRFENAAFTQGSTVVAARTRSVTMALATAADGTPTAGNRTNAPSVMTMSSDSGTDGEVFN